MLLYELFSDQDLDNVEATLQSLIFFPSSTYSTHHPEHDRDDYLFISGV